ncbi:MAG: hypothetical protein RR184_14095 [Citrobacter sp.]|jgi:hypothetical protein|uniref:Uncharacterized protein n=1 Tax=Citrobacter tructae TaxID=2562449 RepID=A0ABX5T2X9_9ENTR|nr:hypothetical protein [Citrobacter tructae]QBX79866.1 hypothetical protein E4Z61_05595 [Citrobacter tructae]
MWLFKWYVWNRWVFKLLSRDVAEPEQFLRHCWEENLAKCRDYATIWRDINRIHGKQMQAQAKK